MLSIVERVSFEVRAGEVIALIGESGSGKTTLGREIAGLMRARSGEVSFQGRKLGGSVGERDREQLRAIQFAFQMADVALNPRHRVEKILGRPLSFYFGLGGEGAQRRVRELLALVELPASYASRYPRQLSGGERQRVNLARALAAEPKLIVCDEITSALDTVVAQADSRSAAGSAGTVGSGLSVHLARYLHRRESRRYDCRHAE